MGVLTETLLLCDDDECRAVCDAYVLIYQSLSSNVHTKQKCKMSTFKQSFLIILKLFKFEYIYRQTFNIRRTTSQHLDILRPVF